MAKRKAATFEEPILPAKKPRRGRAGDDTTVPDEAHAESPRRSSKRSAPLAKEGPGESIASSRTRSFQHAVSSSAAKSDTPKNSKPAQANSASKHETAAKASKAPKASKTTTKDTPAIAADQAPEPTKRKRKTKEEKEREAMPVAARSKGLRHFIGAHVSIAKGVHNSVQNALHIGGNAFALFLKSQRKWESPPMQEEHATLFHGLCSDHDYLQKDHVLPHGSYLVNLASVNPEQRQKSITSFLDDMKRCQRLGIKLYNFHPGNTNGAPRDEACARIAEAIDQAHAHVPEVTPLLETMASNKTGSNVVGSSFEDLARIIGAVKDKSRVGVCIDTCHVHAAGYDIVSEEGFRQTMGDFDRVVGREYLRAWHLNDSKAPFGSGRDLHANIGTGFIGLKGFWNVMNMDVWGEGVGVCGIPMVLETPTDEWTAGTTTDKKGNVVTKKVEDKSVWAREIKLLESLVGMDLLSDEYAVIEKDLSDRGREKREKMTAATEKRQLQAKLKEQRAKAGKGSKKNQTDQDKSSHDEELDSELSELEEDSGDEK